MTLNTILINNYPGFTVDVPAPISESWDSLFAILEQFDLSITNAIADHTRSLWQPYLDNKPMTPLWIEDPCPSRPVLLIGPCSKDYGAWGCTGNKPFVLIDRQVAEWPPGIIECLLAHEVAHYYHHAAGFVKTGATEEDNADSRMFSWGYNPGLLRVWSSLAVQLGRTPSQDELEDQRKRLIAAAQSNDQEEQSVKTTHPSPSAGSN